MNTLGKGTKDINDKINIKKITNFSISFQLYTVILCSQKAQILTLHVEYFRKKSINSQSDKGLFHGPRDIQLPEMGGIMQAFSYEELCLNCVTNTQKMTVKTSTWKMIQSKLWPHSSLKMSVQDLHFAFLILSLCSSLPLFLLLLKRL